MTQIIMQILIGLAGTAIAGLCAWAVGVHTQLIELKTWKSLFEEQSRTQYTQIHDLLSEVREDIKKLSERKNNSRNGS